jgi:hypothetical protein
VIDRLKKKFYSKEGMAAPLKIVLVIVIMMIAAILFEAIRLIIVLRGVSMNVEDAAHRVIIANYESSYSHLRESGTGAYKRDANGTFVESITPYKVISELERELSLVKDGSKYISYAGPAKEFEISDIDVTVRNPGMRETVSGSGSKGKMSALIKVKCRVFWHAPLSDLPSFTATIEKEAGFINKF